MAQNLGDASRKRKEGDQDLEIAGTDEQEEGSSNEVLQIVEKKREMEAIQKGKRKAEVGNLLHFNKTHISMFSCHEAALRHKSFINKIAYAPKGFCKQILLAHPIFQKTITTLGWEVLCDIPCAYNLDWVREFYTELSVTNGTEITVRQTPICISVSKINQVLGINQSPKQCEFQKLCNAATDTEWERILSKIAHKGSCWEFHENQRMLATQNLLPIANVWYYFLRHTLIPGSHDNYLCILRVLILFCIMDGHKIDVGRLISNHIFGGADRANARMPHPSIIHSLMLEANTPILSTDEFSNEKMIIDKTTVDRLLRNNVKYRPSQGSDRIASLEATLNSFKEEFGVALSKHAHSFTPQMDDISEKRWELIKKWRKRDEEEKQVWLRYEKARDDAMRLVWSMDHPQILKTIPPFPQHLMWQAVQQPPTRSE